MNEDSIVKRLIIGDDKPFHLPECECQRCEQWRKDNGITTREVLNLALELIRAGKPS